MKKASRFLVIPLVTALTACSPTARKPAPAAPIDPPLAAPSLDFAAYESAWTEVARLERENRPDDVRRVVARQITRDDFGALSEPLQYQWLHAAALIEYRSRAYENAHQIFKLTSRMSTATAEDWAFRFISAQYAKDQADATFSLTTTVLRYPEQLPKFDAAFLNRTLLSPEYRVGNEDARLQLLNALYSADWKLDNGFEPSALWADFTRLLVERGENERAATVASRVTDPRVLLSLRVDKRFDALVRANPARFDVDAAVRQKIETLERLSTASPRKLVLRYQLIHAFVDAAQYQRAWDLAAAVIDDPSRESAYDDYEGHINWVLDTGGEALRGLGRWPEALRFAEQAAARQESGRPNVSNAINLGALHGEFGRSRAALAALGTMAFETEGVSDYGGMQIHHVLLMAAIADRDATGIRNALEYMEEHQTVAVGTYQLALLDANEPEKAAALLIRRLKDPTLRGAALADMQEYRVLSETPLARTSGKRWRQITLRSDVQVVLADVGRIEKTSLAPRTF